MEIEVGMYVRIINTLEEYVEIIRIKENYEFKKFIIDENGRQYSTDEVLKASHNIIDLIEVGDYVNGYKVYEVDKVCHRITLNGSDDGNEFRLTYLRPALGKNMGIKSIVTKEQFERCMYKVGD